MQDVIDQARAAFAGVTEPRVALHRARIDARAAAARQSGDTCAPGTGFTGTGQ